MKTRKRHTGTRLVHAGKDQAGHVGKAVNPPLVRASTVVFDSMQDWQDMRKRRSSERLFTYGARGTPTTFALEDMVTELEGGYRTRLYPTGLAAIAMVFLSYLRPGDHVLISDCTYLPVRALGTEFLAAYGIGYSFFSAQHTDLSDLVQSNSRMVYVESPGSLVYEMLDLPALAAFTRERNLLLVADNTWGSGVLYHPLALGADISVMAATKYLGGHSDVMMGTVCTQQTHWDPLNRMSEALGMTVSPDDAWLVLRGIRSLRARLQMHQQHAEQVLQWLSEQKVVSQLFSPVLPQDPGHTLWQRDCQGGNGLLSFAVAGVSEQRVIAMLDALQLFGLGASWGGYESLAALADLSTARSQTDWSASGPIVRLHIGLEDPEDLIADLEQAFQHL
ncbi:cystathionine beta-lyase [Alcaligenes faecalis]|uniref:cystathionine beta-lyase n=1 Tax=Alcaligenes faecalis TaxID=511 RepID=UPI00052C6678|nr:cystathionine beta-lyase [Alcaligenes faecalis]KGP00885.1 cystathionine beta-lyase [Alcaligenes faecalis]